MELVSQYVSTSFLGLLAILFLIYMYRLKQPTKRCTAPEAGGAWPIIGHLHLFSGGQLLHKTLGAMAEKYGPVFTIKLGLQRALIVSSFEIARECFTVHDKVFSTRPRIKAARLLGYNYAMFGFAPYDSYWIEIRKISTVQLLSNRRLDMLKHVRALEMEKSMRELHRKSHRNHAVLVDMKRWFGYVVYNVALRMVVGKSCMDCDEIEAQRIQNAMRKFFYLFGVFVISDTIPFIGWLDLQGYEKAMKSTAKELDTIAVVWLEEHKRKRLLRADADGDEHDFMDVMLTALESASIPRFDVDTITKATCLNLIIGATDTTEVMLTWALSLLLNNRQALEKAQAELDVHVGPHRRVNESDIKNLVYLQAIMKETLRLYPSSPFAGLRAASEDCTLSSGYQIPAGTRLMVNLWKIHRDDRVWPAPNEFKPERFLTTHKDIDVQGQNFEFLPFGSGRRLCPGISLAFQVTGLTLASLLHGYDIATPSGEVVDMTESAGLMNLKATPLDVLLTPRLHSQIYV